MLGRGFVADAHGSHDGPAREWLGAQAPTQQPMAFLAQVGGALNQGKTETCVGQAFKRAIDLRCAALGLTVPSGSALAIRNMALQLRQVLDGQKGAPLLDEGCEPSLAIQAIRNFGLPSETSFPFDPAHATDKVNVAELEDADKRVALFVRGFRGIDGDDESRLSQVRQALDAGFPVPLAIYSLRGDFEAPGGQVLDALPVQRTADHMTCLIGYRADGAFRLLNSWGPWNGDGTCWVTPAFVQQASDLFVVDVSPGSP